MWAAAPLASPDGRLVAYGLVLLMFFKASIILDAWRRKKRCALAHCLLGVCRQNDIVCRIGGEEFFILVPETALPGALRQAERLREAFDPACDRGLG